jgi:hypothetical protein
MGEEHRGEGRKGVENNSINGSKKSNGIEEERALEEEKEQEEEREIGIRKSSRREEDRW